MEELTYRKLTAEDAPRYRALRLESLQRHPASFGAKYEEQRRLPRLRFEQALLERVDDRFMIGAFAGSELIGICGCLAFVPEFVPDKEAWPRTGVIIQVYVQSNYGGRRVGLRLMRETLAAAFAMPAIDQVMLEVARGNDRARRVYEQAGLRVVNAADAAAPEDVMVIGRAEWEGGDS